MAETNTSTTPVSLHEAQFPWTGLVEWERANFAPDSHKSAAIQSGDEAFDKLLAIARDIRTRSARADGTSLWYVGAPEDGELLFMRDGLPEKIVFSTKDFVEGLGAALYDEMQGSPVIEGSAEGNEGTVAARGNQDIDKKQMLGFVVDYLEEKTASDQTLLSHPVGDHRREAATDQPNSYPTVAFAQDMLKATRALLNEKSVDNTHPSAPDWRHGPLGFLSRTLKALSVSERSGAEYWRTPALGMEVEEHLGVPAGLLGYARAYANWLQLVEAMKDGSSKAVPAFEILLSEAQRNSYLLLREWWDGGCQDKALSDAAITFIQEASTLDTGMDLTTSRSLGNPIFKPHHGRTTTGGTPLSDSKTGESPYHAEMFRLWLYEFYSEDDAYTADSPEELDKIRNIFLARLFKERRIAAAYAACQRMAYSTLRSSDIIQPTTNPVHLPPGHSNQAGATIEPCPWLHVHRHHHQREKESPYFLWDIHAQRTVAVPDLLVLGAAPEYVAISHTWGRWQIESHSISVDGVPWKVPCNTRFDVTDLPGMMHSLPFSTRFVWMDLLCIPQEVPRPKRALQEIARQAVIFAGAEHVVAWFSDVGDWRGLRAATRWLALGYLRAGGKDAMDAQGLMMDEAATVEAGSKTGFLVSYEGDFNKVSPSPDPAGWFTSLWTLQESCIRPDMLFCDRQWRLAHLHERPITLDTLVALVQTIYDVQSQRRADSGVFPGPSPELLSLTNIAHVPTGPAELLYLFVRTGLADLLNATPTSILILGNQRYCKHSRAEAIMSVIGAKTWFTNYVEQFGSSPPEGPDQLVMGKYPLAFVNEMRRMFGSSFFDSQGGAPPAARAIVRRHDEAANETEINVLGSLLPFGDLSAVANVKRSYGWGSWDMYWRDHGAVESWEVQRDGSVLITSAGVVASTHIRDVPAASEDVVAQVIVADDSGRRVRLRTHLQKWLASLPREVAVHVVCVAHCDLCVSAGIILIGVAPDAEPHGLYVKWGEYSEIPRINHPAPPSRTVSWRVI